MSTGVEVVLSWDDVSRAARIGVARHLEALAAQRQNRFGYDGEDSWTIHIEGACGELAFAQALRCEWDESVGRFSGMGGDVGDFQVRTRSKHWYELIVRPDADPEDVYVLVTGTAPRFVIRGAAKAGRVMRPEFLKPHGGRVAAYFVPHSELRSITRLIAR